MKTMYQATGRNQGATMNAIQFDLGGGASLALPADVVAQRLIEGLRTKPSHASAARPRIGEYLAGQGGIYVGDILGDEGALYGLVAAQEEDTGSAKWGPDGTLDLPQWDGLSNTNALRDKYPAAKLASSYECDGHADFYLPARRELIVALANVPHIFGKKSWYWTSTPRGARYAWAVGFEDGGVYSDYRDREFRVRPFRRFTLNPFINFQEHTTFEAQAASAYHIPEATIYLRPGEHYAGVILGQGGEPSYHVILMAEKPTDELNWQAAMDWAKRVGGELPTRREQPLLFANLKEQFDKVAYWSAQEHEPNSSYAWYQGFDDGYQITDRKTSGLRARAVRRLSITV